MALSVAAMIIQALLCNLILQPDANTDVGAAQVIFLIVSILTLVISVYLSVNKGEDSQTVRNLIILSLLIRLVILFWDIYARDIFVLPNSEGDAVWYKSASQSYAFFSRANQYDYNEYSFYIGQLYRIIGIQEITSQYLNVYFAIFSIVLLYKILCMFDISVQNRKLAISLACFLPNSLMIMTFFLQESVIAFCIILTLYFYTKWWFTRKVVFFIASFIPSLLGSFLHSGSIVPVIAIVTTFAFVANQEHRLKMSALAMIGGILISLVVFAYISSNSGSLFAKIGGTLSADSVVQHAGLTDTVTSADYFIGIKGLPSVLDLIVNSPIRMLYFIASPVPWMWRGINDVVGFFGSSIFYIIAFMNAIKLIKNRKDINREDGLWAYFFVLFIMVLFATFMFGWGVSNSGTALRHREKFTYIFIILFAITKEMTDRAKDTKDEESVSDSSRLQRGEVSA